MTGAPAIGADSEAALPSCIGILLTAGCSLSDPSAALVGRWAGSCS
jgi:hypothetical protein